MPASPTGTEGTIERDLIRWTRKVAIFTGVLAGVTGLLVVANIIANYFIYQQWHVASQAQEDTRSQLRAVVTINATSMTVSDYKNGKPEYYSFEQLDCTRSYHSTISLYRYAADGHIVSSDTGNPENEEPIIPDSLLAGILPFTCAAHGLTAH